MPNHFTTIGFAGRDYRALEAKGLDDYPDMLPLAGVNLCELAAPLPGELANIAASTPPCRYRHKTTGEWGPDCNGPVGIELSRYERVPLTQEEIAELKAKHGAATWYDWQTFHWGTKWGTYATKVHELGGDGSPVLIEFQSAWGPPSADMMRWINDYLCREYCLKNIRWLGHDPYDNSIVAIDLAPPVATTDAEMAAWEAARNAD